MIKYQKINTSESITLAPTDKATGSVIWLHGLGADGHDFVPIVPDLNLPENLNLRFIFPHAPVMPVTVNQGLPMRAWFDIYSMDFNFKFDEEGVNKSVSLINKLIEEEIQAGIPADNIVVIGFSQGAAIALSTGIRYKLKLRGIAGLSGFLPTTQNVIDVLKTGNKDVPIFIAHGTDDHVVPYILGKKTAEMLINAEYQVSWHDYPMAHSVSQNESRDLGKWLANIYQSK